MGAALSSWIAPRKHISDIWGANGPLSLLYHPQPLSSFVNANTFIVSAVALKALLQDHLEGPTPTASDSVGLGLALEFTFVTWWWWCLLPPGNPWFSEILLLSGEEKVCSHPPPTPSLAFRFCQLVNLALGIYLVSLASAYFLFQNALCLTL